MNKKVFAIIATVLVLNTKAQTWVVIPDANFVTYLHTIVPAAMYGDSLDTSSTLVTTTTHSISVYNKNISDLTGVQYFTSLTYLNCDDNPITTLPALPSTLIYLNCSNTFLSSLPSLPNSLVYLNCQHNSLTSLPALPAVLDTLDCGGNHLGSLPVLPSSLIVLSCYSNSLTTLPTLPNSLNYLTCFSNSLTTLPILPNTLQYLSCENNSLTNLPTLPPSLTYLMCASNALTSLPALPNTLTFLDLDDNSVKMLPTLPNSLTFLSCYRDSLTGLPTLPDSLTALDCRYNQIQCFPYIPKKISPGELFINFNPFNCLPNYTKAMGSDTITYPLCAAGNTHGCAVAGINGVMNNDNQITIYPNPSSGNFTLSSTNNIGEIKVSNMLGQIVYTEKQNTLNSTLNLNESGIYFISITVGLETSTKKVVVNK